MQVDVHTHVWPEPIAPAVLEHMVREFGYEAVASNTVIALKAHMKESGVDVSVVLGVTERADQVRRTNDWLISIQDDTVVPFGAIHPLMDDKAGEIRRLREAGIRGIKLHPLLNSFYPDDPSMFPVYEEMSESMVLEVHSGRWPQTKSGETIYSSPRRIMNVVNAFPKLKVVALHLGGFYMLDEAERDLIGKENVFIDTTWPPSVGEIAQETLVRIINKHGAHKVCFGTDFPLANQEHDADFLRGLPVPARDMDGILGNNARELLGL